MKYASRLVAFCLVIVITGCLAFVNKTNERVDRMTCRAHDGQPVDWFIIYKLPVNARNGRAGLEYLYSDSRTGSSNGWAASSVTIDSPNSMPGLTLRSVYSSNSLLDRLVLMYNDETPNGTSSESLAHAKGVVAFDGESGFWMTHSIPRFPPLPKDGYSYPSTGTRYGQTMLCVSLDFKQADLVGQQLLYYRPFVYYWSSSGVEAPNLSAVARGEHVVDAPWFRRADLASRERTLQLVSFAKSRPFGRDLYSEWMSDELQSTLFVETWSNGQGHPMPSNCSKQSCYSVLNVKQVRLFAGRPGDPGSVLNDTFSSHDDHSKWAVSGNEYQPWVCVADINRMDSQRHRGGGSLCFRHAQLWRQFSRAADRLEPCPLSADHVALGYAPRSGRPFKPAKKKAATPMGRMKVGH